MSESSYFHLSHNVSNLVYHIVCPAKYRRIVFETNVEEHLKQICVGIEARYDYIHFLLPCLQQEAQMMMKDFSVQISCPIVMLVWKHRHTTEHDVTSGDPEPEILSVDAILHAQMIGGFKARIFMNTPTSLGFSQG